MYNGFENTHRVSGLLPKSGYLFRVKGLNVRGIAGETSGSGPNERHALCRTETSRPMLPRNADEMFTIECTGDVVVGDTILFTERLYIGRDGKLLTSANPLTFNTSVETPMSSKPDNRLGRYIGERTIAAVVRNGGSACVSGMSHAVLCVDPN